RERAWERRKGPELNVRASLFGSAPPHRSFASYKRRMREVFHIAPEVLEAIERGTAVALETSVVAQGLPAPANLEAARRCARAVREAGAVPAAIALLDGGVLVGARGAGLRGM